MRIPAADSPSAVPLPTAVDKLPVFKPDPTSTGQIPYKIPGISKPCFTSYKVFGHLPSSRAKSSSAPSYNSSSTNKLPIIFLHGGPGACHEYLLPFVDLYEKYGHPCIFYDQVGNGASTRLREKKGDESFFTVQLYVNELDNLVDHFGLRDNGFYILGQSWGGMLGSDYATRNPKGLKRLIIANSPASMKLWVQGCNRLIKDLPEETQEAIKYSLKTGNYGTKEFEAANDLFSMRHLYRVETGEVYPGPYTGAAEYHLKEDDTVYGTMNGPVEFIILGNLSSWSVIDRLHKIDIPVLTYHGQFDEATDESVKPFFENIRKVKWVTVDGASHMAHIERRERVMGLVADFFS